MTTQEFLAELESVSRQFDWTLRPDRPQGQDRRSRPRLHLRALIPGSPAPILEPLGAVCYARTGKAFEGTSWPEAARELGLNPADAARLLAAAHDRTWEDQADGTRKPVDEMLALRKRMLAATGVLMRPAVAQAAG
jgi:hypothetical protein